MSMELKDSIDDLGKIKPSETNLNVNELQVYKRPILDRVQMNEYIQLRLNMGEHD